MRKFSIDKVRFYCKPANVDDIPGMVIPRKELRKYEIFDIYDVYDALWADETDFVEHDFMDDILDPPPIFIMTTVIGRIYLIKTEGFNYARYIVEILDY